MPTASVARRRRPAEEARRPSPKRRRESLAAAGPRHRYDLMARPQRPAEEASAVASPTGNGQVPPQAAPHARQQHDTTNTVSGPPTARRVHQYPPTSSSHIRQQHATADSSVGPSVVDPGTVRSPGRVQQSTPTPASSQAVLRTVQEDVPGDVPAEPSHLDPAAAPSSGRVHQSPATSASSQAALQARHKPGSPTGPPVVDLAASRLSTRGLRSLAGYMTAPRLRKLGSGGGLDTDELVVQTDAPRRHLAGSKRASTPPPGTASKPPEPYPQPRRRPRDRGPADEVPVYNSRAARRRASGPGWTPAHSPRAGQAAPEPAFRGRDGAAHPGVPALNNQTVRRAAGFGSNADRFRPVTSEHPRTGPGTFSEHPVGNKDGAPRPSKAGFGSVAARFRPVTSEHPRMGPGAYETSTGAFVDHPLDGGKDGAPRSLRAAPKAGFGSVAARFRPVTSEHPRMGPGAYETSAGAFSEHPIVNEDGTPHSSRAQPKSGFGGAAARFRPVTSEHPRMGPGAYEMSTGSFAEHLIVNEDGTPRSPRAQPKSGFGCAAARFRPVTSEHPRMGPGAYETSAGAFSEHPIVNEDGTPHSSRAQPKSGFGGAAARFRPVTSEHPRMGPGAYETSAGAFAERPVGDGKDRAQPKSGFGTAAARFRPVASEHRRTGPGAHETSTGTNGCQRSGLGKPKAGCSPAGARLRSGDTRVPAAWEGAAAGGFEPDSTGGMRSRSAAGTCGRRSLAASALCYVLPGVVRASIFQTGDGSSAGSGRRDRHSCQHPPASGHRSKTAPRPSSTGRGRRPAAGCGGPQRSRSAPAAADTKGPAQKPGGAAPQPPAAAGCAPTDAGDSPRRQPAAVAVALPPDQDTLVLPIEDTLAPRAQDTLALPIEDAPPMQDAAAASAPSEASAGAPELREEPVQHAHAAGTLQTEPDSSCASFAAASAPTSERVPAGPRRGDTGPRDSAGRGQEADPNRSVSQRRRLNRQFEPAEVGVSSFAGPRSKKHRSRAASAGPPSFFVGRPASSCSGGTRDDTHHRLPACSASPSASAFGSTSPRFRPMRPESFDIGPRAYECDGMQSDGLKLKAGGVVSAVESDLNSVSERRRLNRQFEPAEGGGSRGPFPKKYRSRAASAGAPSFFCVGRPESSCSGGNRDPCHGAAAGKPRRCSASTSASAFGSASPRFHQTRSESFDIGPGAYECDGAPADRGARPRAGGVASPFASATARFSASAVEPEPTPGPFDTAPAASTRSGSSSVCRWSSSKTARFPAKAAAPGVDVCLERFGDAPQKPTVTPRGVIAFGSTATRFV
ncbi:hypothetical protein DIPPA_03302 [Diplonema papillatum]|nr:hypothetical protein DIPPA_03302 [Diplonema papillatum]